MYENTLCIPPEIKFVSKKASKGVRDSVDTVCLLSYYLWKPVFDKPQKVGEITPCDDKNLSEFDFRRDSVYISCI